MFFDGRCILERRYGYARDACGLLSLSVGWRSLSILHRYGPTRRLRAVGSAGGFPAWIPAFVLSDRVAFYHLFAELDILIDNRSGQPITEVSVGGFIPTAQVDFRTLSAKPVYGTPPSDVLAYCAVPDERYQVVLVPQRNDMTVRIRTEDGVDRMRTIHGAPLAYGESYKLRVALTSDARFELVLDGDIVDWGYAGSIGDDGNGDGTGGGEGSDPSTVLTYEGETYRIETINGKQWMTENLRYALVGAVPYDDYFYPNDERNSVASLGLLYRYKTAVGESCRNPTALLWCRVSVPTDGVFRPVRSWRNWLQSFRATSLPKRGTINRWMTTITRRYSIRRKSI